MTENNEIIRIQLPDDLLTYGIACITFEEQDIVILSHDNEYRAIERWCPHEDGDLGEGLMFGKHIKCPIHGYIFELDKGQCLNQLNMRAQIYEVEIDSQELILRKIA